MGVFISGDGGTKTVAPLERKGVSTIANLDAVSPIDGRYRRLTKGLSEFFSEGALIRYRVQVEVEYLIALSERPVAIVVLTQKDKEFLRTWVRSLNTADADIVRQIEVSGYGDIKATNHDVKAMEYFMRLQLKETPLAKSLEWIHFGLTSEDVNNIAYALMLRDAIQKVIIPALEALYGEIDKLALEHQKLQMLARTHGQPATPTTFGKEFNVFAVRLERHIEQLRSFEILTKLNGATGNWNAHVAAFPNIDWRAFSSSFIDSLNNNKPGPRLVPNNITTQIESHDTYAELFDMMKRLNTVIIGFNQDMWRYISDNWIVQKPVEGEVGSSTMPHKINPISFENSEGNLQLANALLEFFSRKLPIARLQRDLTDSTVERNFGAALAYCLIGYSNTMTGLGKIYVNKEKVAEELKAHPEILAEVFQTILRRENVPNAYDKLKALTRKGDEVTYADFEAFVNGLEVSEEVKTELRSWRPENYIGYAAELARE